jgi:hypothetical protein
MTNISKTLESGKEAQHLFEKYVAGDDTAYRTLQTYCKNDVRMTLLTRLALIDQQKIWRDGQEINYTLDEFVQ